MRYNSRCSLSLAIRIPILLIALASIFSFSQEQESKIRFGGRVANSSNFFLSEDNLSPQGYGYGFAAGAVASIPISSTITFNPELNLIWRAFEMWEGTDYPTMNEIVVSIPALFQFMPLGGPLFYIETGIQLDWSFVRNDYRSSGLNYDYNYNSYYYSYNYKDGFLGIPFGLGWHIGKHFVIDYRIIIDLFAYGNRTYTYILDSDYEQLGLLQSEVSLLYLF